MRTLLALVVLWCFVPGTAAALSIARPAQLPGTVWIQATGGPCSLQLNRPSGPHHVFQPGGLRPWWSFSCQANPADRFVLSADGLTVARIPACDGYVDFFHADGTTSYRAVSELVPRSAWSRPRGWLGSVASDGDTLTLHVANGHAWTFALCDGSLVSHSEPGFDLLQAVGQWCSANHDALIALGLLAGVLAQVALVIYLLSRSSKRPAGLAHGSRFALGRAAPVTHELAPEPRPVPFGRLRLSRRNRSRRRAAAMARRARQPSDTAAPRDRHGSSSCGGGAS
ncbi:MAG: hypothetical protein AB7K09_09945 [Planctomycetota bacterium]